MDEVRRDFVQSASFGPRRLLEALAGIEALLAHSPDDGTLSQLVAWDANWVLDDPSDQGAKVWLSQLVELIREVLGDRAPPR